MDTKQAVRTDQELSEAAAWYVDEARKCEELDRWHDASVYYASALFIADCIANTRERVKALHRVRQAEAGSR